MVRVMTPHEIVKSALEYVLEHNATIAGHGRLVEALTLLQTHTVAPNEATEEIVFATYEYLVPMSDMRRKAPAWEMRMPAVQHFYKAMLSAARGKE